LLSLYETQLLSCSDTGHEHFRHFVALLGQGIGPSLGSLYLHRKIQAQDYSLGRDFYTNKLLYITELYLMITVERETRSSSHIMNTHCITGT
jgi:hypothetical protein